MEHPLWRKKAATYPDTTSCEEGKAAPDLHGEGERLATPVTVKPSDDSKPSHTLTTRMWETPVRPGELLGDPGRQWLQLSQ